MFSGGIENQHQAVNGLMEKYKTTVYPQKNSTPRNNDFEAPKNKRKQQTNKQKHST